MKILAIGAHPDDISLFCGGTLFRAIKEGHEVKTIVCTGGEHRGENRIQEEDDARKFLGVTENYYLGFEDGHLEHGIELVSKIENVVKEYKPDVVFSHSDYDSHQDHQSVYHCVKSANRNWSFSWLTYESYDIRAGFISDLFVDISDYFQKKLELLKIFKSQQDRWYFQQSVVEARSLGAKIGKYVERYKVEYLSV